MKWENQKIIITGLHLAVTDAIKSRIHAKVEKLYNHESHIQGVRIELEQEGDPSHAHEFSAKGHVEMKGGSIVITETGDDLYHCINILVENSIVNCANVLTAHNPNVSILIL